MSTSPKQETHVSEESVASAKTSKSKANGGTKSRGKAKKGQSGGFVRRQFPALDLEEAMRIPNAIKEFNGGNPWSPKELAKAVKLSVKNPKFYYLTGSSRDYGLTTGSSITNEIALTDLGRRLVYPPSAEAEASAARDALFHVEAFKAAYEYYQGGELPELKYLSNTLETQFKLPRKVHDEFHKFYTSATAYLRKTGGTISSSTQQAKSDVSAPSAIIVGEPKHKSSLRAFVIMPFSEKTERYPKGFFDEVLKNLITPAGVEAGFKVETARRSGSDIIQSTIVNELLEADLVVADLTDHNPNVLFELGLRIAFEKPIALIKAEGTAPVFDVDAMLRVASYNPALWKTTLEADIPRISAHIRGAWEARTNPQTWLKLLRKS